MTTFIQVHLLTFVPPANLNRDDQGRPKTARVGGDNRLRLSSQSLKRAWRTSEIFKTRLAGHLGSRTQRFGETIRDRLQAQGIEEKKALEITLEVIKVFGKPEDGKGDTKLAYTKQLAFLSPAEMAAALDLADRLARGESLDAKNFAAMVLKRADTAADIAMFGRMFADNPDFNREAAVQVAHAITTHAVSIEDDFYTAVDDLNRRVEDVGAGFVGEAGFGSGVFYLYLCIDTAQLLGNLAGDAELARAAVSALVEAAATVSPNGKQASFASRQRASYMLVEKGETQPRTLAAAFAKAVPARDALRGSIKELRDLREKFGKAYGEIGLASMEMDVEAGSGNLAEMVAFASDWQA